MKIVSDMMQRARNALLETLVSSGRALSLPREFLCLTPVKFSSFLTDQMLCSLRKMDLVKVLTALDECGKGMTIRYLLTRAMIVRIAP